MNFLLTYREEGHFDYCWFETEEELKYFATIPEIEVCDALEIYSSREININEQ
ncbi:hypothetical protein [Clostridium senegalense]